MSECETKRLSTIEHLAEKKPAGIDFAGAIVMTTGVVNHFHHRIAAGSVAPDFLISQAAGEHPLHLSDLRGQPVILAFFSAAWDPARPDQLNAFNKLISDIPGVSAELVAVSRNGMWTDLTFAHDAERVPVLSDLDPTGLVAEQYGVIGKDAVMIVDSHGMVRWRHDDAPSFDELKSALETASRSDTAERDDEIGFGFTVRPSRREFVMSTFAAALALVVLPRLSKADSLSTTENTAMPTPVASSTVALRINGKAVSLTIEPRVTLLDALREYAGLTGTKKGCDHGQCGACTVHVNGRRQLSCLTFAMMHQGDEITTVEGLASGGDLHPMQAAFIEHDGFQCGYCTPGQLMSATALLKEPCGPTDSDVKECMSGNICRCGAYPGIVAAIQEVRGNGRA